VEGNNGSLHGRKNISRMYGDDVSIELKLSQFEWCEDSKEGARG